MIARLRQPGALAGLLFAALGVGVVALAADYPAGDMRRMGPGWMPEALGWTLVVLGLGIASFAVLARGAEELPKRDTRPLLCLLAGVAAFAVLLEPAGLVAAIFACVALSRLAERPYRPAETLLVAAFLSALGAGIFVYGLGLPIPLFGR